MSNEPASWAHLLWQRAERSPDRIGYTYLSEPAGSLTYGALHERAAMLAARLLELASPGDRAVLLIPPGLDYLTGFFGCLYAGVVAVPAYPPLDDRQVPRLLSLIASSRPRLVLTQDAFAEMIRDSLQAYGSLDVLAVDVPDGPEPVRHPPRVGPEDIAFLQYTSGSVGDPKGVIVTHANLFDNSAAIRMLFGHSEDSVGVIWLPPYHDMGLIGGILQPLYAGFPVALMSPLEILADPARWLHAVSEQRATTSGGPNFAFDLCVHKTTEPQREGLDLSSWSVAFCGAEPVRAASLARFAKEFEPYGFSPGALYPCYGLAESTLITSGGTKGAGICTHAGMVSCGRVIPGHRLTVRTADGTAEVAEGEVGEVYLSGPSVSPGYWEHPAADAEAFIRGPAGEHIMRTGDLGFLHDGELYVTGRCKDLVIVRGRNLAAADVEVVVSACHPLVRTGCVAAFGVAGESGEELAVLIELRGGADDAQRGEVRGAVQTALAASFGVTAGRILLAPRGTVLKTPSGKVRRAECRAQYLAGALPLLDDWPAPGEPAQGEPAGGTAEQRHAVALAELAATVLGLPAGSIGTDIGLTSLGLDSLRAVELRHAAAGKLGLELPLPVLLGGASPAGLARAAVPVSSALTGSALTGEPAAQVVTDGERALWATSRLSGDPAHYVLTIALNFDEAADPATVERLLGLLAGRHPALRTSFPDVAGTPVRRPSEAALTLRLVELADEAAVDPWITRFAAEGVDPATAVPWKVALLRPAGGPDVLVLCVHHMACDLWSLDVLAREFEEGYRLLRRGQRPQWAPAGDPGRLAARQAAVLSGPAGRRLERFWGDELGERPPAGGLPQARRKRHGSAPAARHYAVLPGPLAARLRDVAREAGVTPYTVLFGGFAWLLYRYTGERRFILGAPAPGRLDPESVGAVGYFVNPLPVLCEIDPARDFRSHLAAFRDRIATAMAHQELPYQQILNVCGWRRGEPAIRVLMLEQQTPSGVVRTPPVPGLPRAHPPASVLAVRRVEQRNAPFELTIEVSAEGAGLVCSLTYDAEALPDEAVQAAAAHWVHLLEQIADRPDSRPDTVDLLRPRERRLVLEEWNAREVATAGPSTMHGAVLAVATGDPAAIAARDEEGELSYGELDRRSARLAAALVAYGAGPDRPVALAMPRSTGLLVAMLAALRAGAPYVPLDPAQPDARLAVIVADARPAVVVTRADLRGTRETMWGTATLTEEEVADPLPPAPPAHPDWPAYVMYTSGSTGTPKGVVCGHRGVLNLLADARLAGRPGPGDRCGWWTSPGFDVSVYEVFLALTRGATVEVCPPGARLTTEAFLEWAAQRGVTSAYVPPHLLPELPAWLARHPGRSRLRHLTVSVEPIPEPLLREIMRGLPGLAVTNGYGPTEATIFSSLYTVDAAGTWDGITPMGRGVRNCPHYLLDAGLRPVPPGAPGEVYIGGTGLAHGYLGRGGQTADRFVPSPFQPGQRLYRTGDLARYRADGQLVFLGRGDDQVKIRGMRIEPREVEAVLTVHPQVSTALVLVHDAADGPRLVGYVHVDADRVADQALAADIVRYVRDRLPGPMVPRHIVPLAEWPMTVNGKIDRGRLPRPDSPGREYAPPDGRVEAAVAEVWAALLEQERVGRGDDFFELGGDSLLAARCAARLAEVLGVPVDAVDLLDHPIVADLATALAGRSAPAAPVDPRMALLEHVAALPADVWEQVAVQTGAQAGGQAGGPGR